MNKIKGSSSAVKMKYLLFVFAAAVLVALPTRVYQLLALVDSTNGFYKESDVTVPVLYAIVVVFSLLFMILSFISKEVPSPKLPTGKNPVLGVASFVVIAGLCWDMFSTLRDIIPVSQGNAAIFIDLLRTNLSQQGGGFALLGFVFAFFAIVYFIVFGISHLNGKASYREFKLLALSPLCWSMTNLISKLMNAISFIKVSELLFEIFMFVFVMLFFLTFARISSGVFTEDSMWGVYGYGLVASLLAAIVTIPRIVIALVGLDAVEGYSFDFSHIAVLVFILAYVFASLGVGFKDGLKNRRAVNDIDLPDDFEVITKKDDLNSFFEEETDDIEVPEAIEQIVEIEESADIEEETADNVKGFEITIDESYFDNVEEDSQEVAVETSEEISKEEETIGEQVEETVEEIEEVSEEQVESTVEESIQEIETVAEEVVDEISEEVFEETSEKNDSDEIKIISLADMKKKKEQE